MSEMNENKIIITGGNVTIYNGTPPPSKSNVVVRFFKWLKALWLALY